MEIIELPLSESFEKKERELALIVILKHLLSGGICNCSSCFHNTFLLLLVGFIIDPIPLVFERRIKRQIGTFLRLW